MELLDNLALGFSTALTLQNLIYCFLGVLLGTMIGVLPGLGPIATIAMLLPATYALPPIAALIMLAGIYTAPSTAAQRPLFWSTSQGNRPRWSRPLTATKWPAVVVQVLRSSQLVLVLSLLAAWQL